jgi:hypothetical protein
MQYNLLLAWFNRNSKIGHSAINKQNLTIQSREVSKGCTVILQSLVDRRF